MSGYGPIATNPASLAEVSFRSQSRRDLLTTSITDRGPKAEGVTGQSNVRFDPASGDYIGDCLPEWASVPRSLTHPHFTSTPGPLGARWPSPRNHRVERTLCRSHS